MLVNIIMSASASASASSLKTVGRYAFHRAWRTPAPGPVPTIYMQVTTAVSLKIYKISKINNCTARFHIHNHDHSSHTYNSTFCLRIFRVMASGTDKDLLTSSGENRGDSLSGRDMGYGHGRLATEGDRRAGSGSGPKSGERVQSPGRRVASDTGPPVDSPAEGLVQCASRRHA
jgi:hypothetical protein